MKQVVFIADDLGLCEAANLAIVRAHESGVLTGASLMTGQPGTAHALELVRRVPDLRIGWHLHLCDSRPLTCPRWPWGHSPWRAGLLLAATPANRRFLAAELAAQWHAFAATGLPCAFVNGHHHLHVHPYVLRLLRDLLPSDFDGWVRGFGVRLFGPPVPPGVRLARLAAPLARRGLDRFGFRLARTLWGLDRPFSMRAAEVRAAIGQVDDGLHEFLFHPRRCEGDADLDALIELRSHANRSAVSAGVPAAPAVIP